MLSLALYNTPQKLDRGIKRLVGHIREIGDVEEAIRGQDQSIENQETAKKDSRISKREAVIREKEAILNHIYSSHGWKALLKYYRIRDKLLPTDSVLQQAAKYFWKNYYIYPKQLTLAMPNWGCLI